MNKKIYLTELFLVFLIFLFLCESIFIYPIRLFLTLIHESFHGFAAVISGGDIIEITLNGLNGRIISSGGYYPFVSISGYIGSALLGALLIGNKYKTFLMFIVFGYVSFILLVYTKFSIEFFVLLGVIGLLGFLKWKNFYIDHIGFILGSFLAVGSFEDLKNYLFAIPSKTDSGLLANYWEMSFLTLPISIFIAVVSLFFIYIGIKSLLKSE